MKNIIFSCLFSCLLGFVSDIAAQSAYVRLEDASGFNTDAFQAELEAAAQALQDSFPAEFQDDFKVYDFGFYLHQEVTDGGYPAAFSQKVAAIAQMSPYYLVFGKQTDRTGIYSKFWVALKLPMTGKFSCETDSERELFRLKLSLSIDGKNNSPLNYSQSEVSLMKFLQHHVEKLKNCCMPQQRIDCITQCLDEAELKQYFEGKAFSSKNVEIAVSSLKPESKISRFTISRVNDFSQLSIIYKGIQRSLKTDADYLLNGTISCFTENNCKIYITKNSDISCDPDLLFEIQNDFAQEVYDFVGWIHVWQSSLDFKDGICYSKFKGKFFSNTSSILTMGNSCQEIPFEASLDIQTGTDGGLDINLITKNIENIYKVKNSINLNVIAQSKSSLGFFDLYEFSRYDFGLIPGLSGIDVVTGIVKQNQDETFVNFASYKPITDKKHGEYYVAWVTAHEYLHQIFNKSCRIIVSPQDPTSYNAAGDSPYYVNSHIGPTGSFNLLYPGSGIPNHHNGDYLPKYYIDLVNSFEKIDKKLMEIIRRANISYALFYNSDPDNSILSFYSIDNRDWLKKLKIDILN